MMNNGQNPVQQCLCDGRYKGCTHGKPCGEPAGGHRSPYFCGDCDPRRIAHIDANLSSFARKLGAS
jgi:hypothetical protein